MWKNLWTKKIKKLVYGFEYENMNQFIPIFFFLLFWIDVTSTKFRLIISRSSWTNLGKILCRRICYIFLQWNSICNTYIKMFISYIDFFILKWWKHQTSGKTYIDNRHSSCHVNTLLIFQVISSKWGQTRFWQIL